MRTLLLVTDSYPYGTGETFLETEIDYLVRSGARVVVVPRHMRSGQRSVPAGVEVVTSLAVRSPRAGRGGRWLPAGVFARLIGQELVATPRAALSPRRLDRLLRHVRHLGLTYRWAASFVEESGLSGPGTLLYTYWLGPPSLALALVRDRLLPGAAVVSRAHGVDLYAERHRPAYVPLRASTLAAVDRVFCVSAHGRQYLAERWPASLGRYEVARLGVRDPGFVAPVRTDDVFRCVSCSGLVAVKRLDRLVDGLAVVAECLGSQRVEWHHLGDGPLRVALEARAARLPGTVTCRFHGHVDNRAVREFYRAQPLDVFVNVSASEGLPVAVMEAQSCGLPVIATAVGGTPEIVGPENGGLLDADPTPEAVGRALAGFAVPTSEVLARRAAARVTWQRVCDAEVNYAAFVERLQQITPAPRA